MRKLLCILSLLAFALSAGYSSPQKETAGTGAKPAETAGGPVTITVGKKVNVSGFKLPEGQDVEKNNYYLNYVKATTGVSFKYEWLLTDDSQRISLAVASGEIPDVMVVNLETLNMLVSSNLIQPLDGAWQMSAGKYLASVAQTYPAALDAAKVNGKLMAIPDTQALKQHKLLWLRQDWIKKLGLKAPTTLEELIATAKAFINQDPDGNGKKDTIGLVLAPHVFGLYDASFNAGADPIANSFGAYPRIWYKKADGKVVYGSVTDENRNALQYMAKLYADGIIDKEFAVRDEKELLTSAKAGLVFGPWYFSGTLKDSRGFDGADWIPTLCPVAADGSYYCPSPVPSISYLVVSRKCKRPDAVIAAIDAEFTFHRLLTGNATYNEQMNDYTKRGISWDLMPLAIQLEYQDIVAQRGADLKQMVEKNGDRTGVSAQNQAFYDAWLAYKADATKLTGWQRYTGMYLGCNLANYGKNRYTSPCFWGTTKTMEDSWTSLKKMEDEIILKVIMGESAIADFDKFAKSWNDLGGQKITAEIQEYVNKK